ncbi:MAG: phosphoribosylformylglycinamidine synthase subunit PurL [Acidimicrobiales bacterium]
MPRPAAEPVHRALGLTDGELRLIEEILRRAPNFLELSMYAVMWSEHCSYKSSRSHLKRLPTEGAGVIVGPGENAGVVEVAPGISVAIRIESHNHPSAIEPYQGAATGVGGILRDIFTMGARPIALMDSIRFGPLASDQGAAGEGAAGEAVAARNRYLLEGVVAGISGYGNAVGVPTVGGELDFDEGFSGNPLVNVACVGVMPTERLVLARASGTGNLAVLLGSATGRDGIGGVSVLASAGFADAGRGDQAKRPSVQVGDPYEEKRLIEACLEMLEERLVVGIQDLGGAGLCCATSETASRGSVGMDVDVSAVPRREPNMTPAEVMTSESQERMLAIVAPEDLERLVGVCDRWEVRATVVGRVTSGDRLRITDGVGGEVLADVPAASLHDASPVCERPMLARPGARGHGHLPSGAAGTRDAGEPGGMGTDLPNRDTEMPDPARFLRSMLIDARWVYSQYDHQLFLNTVVAPGADATVLRLDAPGLYSNATYSKGVGGAAQQGSGNGSAPARRAPQQPQPPHPPKALAITSDGNHRWCAASPRAGTAMVVAEAAMNLACAGARPVALVNCLNFGNPEHPEVMWELSESVDGMAEACSRLGIPVVGGNVSLYNESGGRDIPPTPVVTMLGVIDELERRPPGMASPAGHSMVLVGPVASGLLGSRYGAGIAAAAAGLFPELDLTMHARVVGALREAVAADMCSAVHDISDGGLLACLAEMATSGGPGIVVTRAFGLDEGLSEAGSRAVVSTRHPGELVSYFEERGVRAEVIGEAAGERLVVPDLVDMEVAALASAARDAIPAALGG